MPKKHPPPLDRLVLQTRKQAGGCIEWTGSYFTSGYGRLKFGGVTVRAHRFSYESFVGHIPDGMNVCHACDNPRCINPQHLWLGTHADNHADRDRKGRHAKVYGENNAAAKLTESAVVEILGRLAEGQSQIIVGADFGVSQSTISLIALGKTWRLVTATQPTATVREPAGV